MNLGGNLLIQLLELNWTQMCLINLVYLYYL